MEKVDERISILKIVITGPESTGKTTLCKSLASYFNTSYVPEYSRGYLQQQEARYTREDLSIIAAGQMKLEDDHQLKNKLLLICDTSLEVIRIWSEWKFKACDKFILEHARTRLPDLFLLLKPDFPWQPDPQRENPDDRDALFAYYQKTLSEYNTKVIEVSGSVEERLNRAIEVIKLETG